MKKLICAGVAVLLMVAGWSAYAGDGCCGAGKAKAEAAGKGGCGAAMSKLNLTDEQKAKINDLMAECKKGEGTAESKAKFQAGLKEILTPEQQAQMQAECKKAGQEGCPMKVKAEKAEAKN